MPAKTRILIVEDNPVWADFLEKRYRFEAAEILGVDRNFVECVRAASFDAAREKILAARDEPYDLVSLDINLGNPGGQEPQKDGLHLLGDIARIHAAWMVAILTGVEKDATFTGSRATIVRRNLRNLAMQTFPPERLVVIEKPSELTSLETTALSSALEESGVLGNRIKQVVSIFEHSTSYRNVFRKLVLPNEYKDGAKADDTEAEDAADDGDGAGKPKRQKKVWKKGAVVHWQIRFDCGEMITIPERSGMEVIRVLLENPRKEFSYGALEAASLGETALSKEDLGAQARPSFGQDKLSQWEQIVGEAEDGDASVGNDPDTTSAAREMVLSGYGTEQDGNYDDTEKQSRDAYIEALQGIEGKIEELQKTPGNGSLISHLKSEAAALKKEIKNLRHGGRTAESTRVAAHKSRVIASLREQGLVDLANHLDECIDPKGTVTYWPPVDMNWQTE